MQNTWQSILLSQPPNPCCFKTFTKKESKFERTKRLFVENLLHINNTVSERVRCVKIYTDSHSFDHAIDFAVEQFNSKSSNSMLSAISNMQTDTLCLTTHVKFVIINSISHATSIYLLDAQKEITIFLDIIGPHFRTCATIL
jgi:hypothetical protein